MICYPVANMCCDYSGYFQMILGGACDPQTRLFAIKELVKAETGPSPADSMAQHYILGYIKTWGESDDSCKAIMSVLTTRLGEDWPCNYKALDVLSDMPDSALVGIMDKLTALTTKEGDAGVHLKALAGPLLARAKKHKEAKEAEEAKKREQAVAAAWGGLMNPNAAGINYPPSIAFGCPPGGVNYYPHYLRSSLQPVVCPLMRCTPGWVPCVHWGCH